MGLDELMLPQITRRIASHKVLGERGSAVPVHAVPAVVQVLVQTSLNVTALPEVNILAVRRADGVNA